MRNTLSEELLKDNSKMATGEDQGCSAENPGRDSFALGWKLLAANKADDVFVTPEADELARRTEEECQAIESVAEPTRRPKNNVFPFNLRRKPKRNV